MPFYERVVLIRVKDPGWTPKSLNIYYLTVDGNLYRLNGTSPPIHEVNARAQEEGRKPAAAHPCRRRARPAR